MKKFLLKIFTILFFISISFSAWGSSMYPSSGGTLPIPGKTNVTSYGAPYSILFNGSIVPQNGKADLGNGTFTNADATNRTYFDADNSGYLTAAAANTARFELVTGSTYKSLLVEPGATNNLLHSRDLSNVAWAKTNCTGTKDQTGLDGSANSASSLTSSAANATCLQTLVLGAADYNYSVYIKRLTGTGTIWITDDNDTNRTECTGLSSTVWTKYSITRSQANPIVGIKILTSGDSIAVDCNQLEAGKFSSRPIHTTTIAVSRTTEAGFPTYSVPPNTYGETLSAELMPNQVDRDFSGASAWANVDLNAYDETDDLTITATAANQYCTLLVASAPMTATNVYKITFDLANVVSTWKLTDFDAGQTLVASIAANGSLEYYVTYSGSAGGGFRLVSNTTTSSGDFDNFSLKEVTNPSSEGGPPMATTVLWVRLGFVNEQISAFHSVLSGNGPYAPIYFHQTNGRYISFDQTHSATHTTDPDAYDWTKVVLKHGYLSSNVSKFIIGVDTGSGIGWGTAVDYDGSLDQMTTTLCIGKTLRGPMWIRSVEIFTDEQRSDVEINAGGSP
jgi:hypothetical protein